MTLQAQFLGEVEDYLARTNTPPTALGKGALGDPNFVFNLREGRSPSLSTVDKVRAWMRKHKQRAA